MKNLKDILHEILLYAGIGLICWGIFRINLIAGIISTGIMCIAIFVLYVVFDSGGGKK